MTELRGYLSHPGRTLVVVGLVVALALLGSAGSALAAPGNGGNNGNGHGTSAPAGKSNAAGNGATSKGSETRRGPHASSGHARGRSGPPRGNRKSSGSFQAMSSDGGEAQGQQGASAPPRQGAGPSGRSGPPAHANGSATSASTGGGQDRPHPHADDEVLSDAVDDETSEDTAAGGGAQTPADGDDAPFAVGTAADGVDTAPPAAGSLTTGAGGETETELTELAGVATPDDAGDAAAAGPRSGLIDRLSRGTSRALDTVLSPTRDFGVPALLVAILLVYLALQRRLDRGALPMSSLTSPSDGNQTHVRFEL